MADDFTLPNGVVQPVNINDFGAIHRDFAMRCK